MKTKKRYMRKVRSGSVLALVLAIGVCLALLGWGMLQLGFGSRVNAAISVSAITAREAADAGLTKAIYLMNQKLNTWPRDFSTLPPPASNVQLNPGSSSPVYSYAVTANGMNRFTISSIGETVREKRRVNAIIRMQSYWGGIGVKLLADIKSSPVFGVIPAGSDYVFSLRTDSISPDQIILFPNTTIPGDVIVGPGGVPDVVIDTKSSSTIVGDTYPASENLEFPFKPVPAGLVPSPLPPAVGGVRTVPPGMYAFPTIDLGNGDKLYFEGNVIFSTPDMRIKNSGELRVKLGGSVQIYVNGSFIADYGSLIYNEDNDARRIRIFGSPTCTSVIVRNSGDFYGAIYAPNADLEIKNSGAAYGGFIGNKLFTKNSAEFYFDVRLLGGIDDPAYFTIERWWEAVGP